MTQFMHDMGFIRWPLLVAALFLFVQIGRALIQVRSQAPDSVRTRHAILVWGLLNALLGLLGTVLGVAVAAQSVARAGTADPRLIGGGLQIALAPSILGLLLLTVAVIAWLVLQAMQPRVPDSGA
jgi:hypothetical protein